MTSKMPREKARKKMARKHATIMSRTLIIPEVLTSAFQ